MFRSTFFFRLVTFILLQGIYPGCQSRKQFDGKLNQSQATQDKLKTGVDLMDLAILFPPPAVIYGDPNARGYLTERINTWKFWMPLVSEGVEGGILNKSDFDTMITLSEEDKSDGGGKGKTGINYSLDTSETVAFGTQGGIRLGPAYDMRESDRWRIVAVRFDPCPYAHVGTSDSTTCTPEFRVIAQPFIKGTPAIVNNNGVRPPQPWTLSGGIEGSIVADYAVHLFHHLKPEQSIALAEKLLSLKRDFEHSCPTTGVPLGVHPCLQKALLEDTTNEASFPSRLGKIVKEYTLGNLDRIAIMGSAKGLEPWFFLSLKYAPREGKPSFHYKKLHATNKLKAPAGSKGNEPKSSLILDDIVQQFDMKNLQKKFGDSQKIKNAQRFIPGPKNESVKGIDSYISEQDDSALADSVAIAQNPLLSNEFTIDCLSCHLSTRVQKTQEILSGSRLDALAKPENVFQPPPGITAFADFYDTTPYYASGKDNLIKVDDFPFPFKKSTFYAVAQFSIFKIVPVIGQRMVNEAAESADYTNKKLLGGLQNPGSVGFEYSKSSDCWQYRFLSQRDNKESVTEGLKRISRGKSAVVIDVPARKEMCAP